MKFRFKTTMLNGYSTRSYINNERITNFKQIKKKGFLQLLFMFLNKKTDILRVEIYKDKEIIGSVEMEF